MPEFSFIIPCLNEEKTLEFCINQIKESIEKNNIIAEILVSDNGSVDKSVEIAKRNGARVVIDEKKGYGEALINGTKNAYGKYCIMGDADGSYDFVNIEKFIYYVRNGYDLVVGNRFKGNIENGAMLFSHKIGGKFISFFANILFHTKIGDFNCGIRAFNREKIIGIKLNHTGMEYASEMIIKAKKSNLKMIEVPTDLKKDLRDHKSHLRTIRDGIRHLVLIFNLKIKRDI